jgi:hypothetical protein
MKKRLATLGLFLSPLLAIFCLVAFVMVSLGSEGRDSIPEAAMQAVSIYRALLLISVVVFIGSIVVLIRGRK